MNFSEWRIRFRPCFSHIIDLDQIPWYIFLYAGGVPAFLCPMDLSGWQEDGHTWTSDLHRHMRDENTIVEWKPNCLYENLSDLSCKCKRWKRMYRGKVPALYVTPDRSVPTHSSNRRKMQAADVSPESLTPELWCVQKGMWREESPVPHPVPVFRVRTTASFGFLQGKKGKRCRNSTDTNKIRIIWTPARSVTGWTDHLRALTK